MNVSIEELLDQWEESFEKGQPLSAEQLCRDCPELLEELRSQINALRAVDANFGSMMGQSRGMSEEELRTSRLNERLQITSVFQIDELHGSGGLGDVYLASEPSMKRHVAVKFPRKDRLSTEQMARFEREAQITGRLNHPGIVPVYSLRHDDQSQPCYVMRFIDGRTLRLHVERLNQSISGKTDYFSTMEFRQLLQNFIAVCNIVAYAHDQGIIHRDIKPENIILGPFGETMLMDWGLAKSLNESDANIPAMASSDCVETVANKSIRTYEGQVMGTPAFASPEQLQGRVDLTDTRSDIYSLGVTLFCIVTGSIGRMDQNTGAILRHCNGNRVPPRLAAICAKAMNAGIDDRYQTVTMLCKDVEFYLAGEPVSVVAETVWSRFARIVRRRPGWVATIAASTLMAIAAGTVGSLLLTQKNRDLSTANQQLEIAVASALQSKQRATSTAELLSNTLQAATPDSSPGKEPTVRQLLDETSKKLRTETTTHPLVAADTHTVIAKAYLSLGLYDAAQEHTELASELYLHELGPDSAETITAQAHQALLMSRRDQDTEAISLASDALKRGRGSEKVDPGSLAIVVDILAHVLSAAPDPDHTQVLKLHQEAYELARESLGPDDRATLRMASNLATARMDAGDLAGAEPLLVEIHTIHASLLGDSHPETLVDVFNLIALHFNKGDFETANALCQSNVSTFETTFGASHQRSIRLRILLTMSFCALNQMDSAAYEGAIALDRAKEHLGPIHQQTFEARGLLATAMIGSGELDAAQTLANEQYETAKESFGATHSYTVQATTLFFELANARGDLDEMERWYNELRGSPWEAEVEKTLKAAREKKQEQPNDEAGSP
ncbi:MAG: serine/threonine protein kinase [Planctomyces sp.]|nr:serine/threonine protein kinase [Planctomyces sp.]